MDIALYIVSLVWIAMGAFLVIYTGQARSFIKVVFPPSRAKVFAVIPFAFGVVLVIGAFYRTQMFWLAFVLGLLGILKGIFLFLGPSDRIAALMQWWYGKASDRVVRTGGLIAFFLGSVIFSYIRQG